MYRLSGWMPRRREARLILLNKDKEFDVCVFFVPFSGQMNLERDDEKEMDTEPVFMAGGAGVRADDGGPFMGDVLTEKILFEHRSDASIRGV